MNIGIFTDTYYPQISGVDTSVRVLKKGLAERNHNVFVFTTTDPDVKEPEPDVLRLPSVPFPFYKQRRISVAYPPRLIWRTRKLGLDLIHTQTEFNMGLFGKACSKLLGIPMLHTYHTMYEDYTHLITRNKTFAPKIARKYSRMFCNGAAAVVTPAEKSRQKLISYGVT